jgi:hypothetical protein
LKLKVLVLLINIQYRSFNQDDAGLRLKGAIDERGDILLGHRADALIVDLATFEDDEGGDAGDSVLSSEIAIGVDIDFENLGFSDVLLGKLLNVGADCFARTTPGSPEIY